MGSALDKFKNEMKKESSSLLPRISVNRPVSVVMGLMALLVVGYIAYSRIPLSLFPEGLEDNWLYINIYYPHASPFEVKEKILPYAEDELSKRSVPTANSTPNSNAILIRTQTGPMLSCRIYWIVSGRICPKESSPCMSYSSTWMMHPLWG